MTSSLARNGGYTAIYKLGPRRGDGAEMARIVLLSEAEKAAAEKASKKKSKKKAAKAEKPAEAPAAETKAPAEEEKTEAAE